MSRKLLDPEKESCFVDLQLPDWSSSHRLVGLRTMAGFSPQQIDIFDGFLDSEAQRNCRAAVASAMTLRLTICSAICSTDSFVTRPTASSASMCLDTAGSSLSALYARWPLPIHNRQVLKCWKRGSIHILGSIEFQSRS